MSTATRLTNSRRGQRLTTSSATATNVGVHVDMSCRPATTTGSQARRRGERNVLNATRRHQLVNVRQQNVSSPRSSSSSTASRSRLYRLTEQLELSQTASRTRLIKIRAESYDWSHTNAVTWSARQSLDHVMAIKWRQKARVEGGKNLKKLKHLTGNNGGLIICQLDRNCDHQISTTTRVVDDTVYFSSSAPSWTQSKTVIRRAC